MGDRDGRRRHTSAQGIPWTRGLFAVAVAGPALALGGVPPEALAAWLLVMGALLWRIARRSRGPLRRPWPAWLLLALAGWTLVAVVPLPGLRGLAAPSLQAWVESALQPAGVAATPGLSVAPAETGLEVARLIGLAGLVLVAGQLSWRLAAAAVAGAGLVVTLVGFGHAFVGTEAIYGLYTPQHALLIPRTALLTTFVNPNHQSGLLLLAIFSAGALAVDQLHGARTARDAAKVAQRRDRGIAMLGALLLLVPALLLSLSRGALLAFAVFAPIALALALVRPPQSLGTKAATKRKGPFALGLLALATVVVTVGRHGAWAELLALMHDPDHAFELKLGPARDGIGLAARSPVFGTGRGTFADLFPLHAPGSDIVFTHLESTPVTALIEWGPWVGTAAVVMSVVWWVRALRHRVKGREQRARTVVLLGLAALAMQSLVDFSLEFIGVAAPTAALVGSLTPHGPAQLPRRLLMRIGPPLGLGLAALTMALAPHTWTRRAMTNAQLANGGSTADALRWRPLDGNLHAIAARQALQSGDVETAASHARFATEVRPGSIDGWLLLAAVHDRRGDSDARDAAVTAALDRVRAPAPAVLLDYVQARYPDPEAVVSITPTRGRAFEAVAKGLRDAGAWGHADVMARTRARTHPREGTPLLLRSHIALLRSQPALALHFAQLARAEHPLDADAQLAVARATAARYGIEPALAELDGAAGLSLAPTEQDRLSEYRVRLLLQRGTPEALHEADTVTRELLLHSQTPDERTRRRALAQEIAAAQP